MNFRAIVPMNVVKALSNGDLRIQLDADRTYAHILPELIELAGNMVDVTLTISGDEKDLHAMFDQSVQVHDMVEDPEERKRLIRKFHAQINEITAMCPKRYTDAADCKDKFKQKNNIERVSELSVEQLEECCNKLNKAIQRS